MQIEKNKITITEESLKSGVSVEITQKIQNGTFRWVEPRRFDPVLTDEVEIRMPVDLVPTRTLNKLIWGSKVKIIIPYNGRSYLCKLVNIWKNSTEISILLDAE